MTRSTRTGGRDATEAVVPGQFGLSVGRPQLEEPPGFRWVALSDLARLESGHTPSRTKPEYWDGDIPWIGIRDATAHHGEVLLDTNQHVSQAGLDNSSARLLPKSTVCLSRTASVGYVVIMGRPMATSQDFVNWVCSEALQPEFLRYLLMAEQESIRRFAFGSVHQTMYYPDAKALYVCIPSTDEQRAIAAVLGALDAKIANNTTLNATSGELLGVHAESAYRKQGQAASVGQVATFLNKRRIPLSSRQRQDLTGQVPYYGAAGQIDTVREAIFNGPITLVGEDGTVATSLGHPVVQHVWGPSWVNNHAHVLRGLSLSTELLGVLIAQADARPLITGAVQPKLSMGKLKGLVLQVPTGAALVSLELLTKDLFALKRSLSAESKTLTELRDALLPALMSGRLRVRDAERQVEDAV